MKIMCLIIVIVLSGCGIDSNLTYYNVLTVDENIFAIEINGESFIKNDEIKWYPRNKSDGKEYEIIGYCDYGYIHKTFSDKCIYIDDLKGSYPYYLYSEDVDLSVLNNGDIASVAIDFSDDSVAEVNIDCNAKEIVDEYFNSKEYFEYALEDAERIGDIIIESGEYPSLFLVIPTYLRDNSYYLYISMSDSLEGYFKCIECSQLNNILKTTRISEN